ncbi:hypothetical protein NCCP28_15090 [Niallia sp. NCCP-28]|nr:hypothetical protein NCCP28_15090 [Niallia sp. NCCP-28]
MNVMFSIKTAREYISQYYNYRRYIAFYGQYHREQINQLLRADELEPINVDYITLEENKSVVYSIF